MRQWVLRALLLGSFSVLSSGAMALLPPVVKQFLEDRSIGGFSQFITCRKIVPNEGKDVHNTVYSLWIAEDQKPDVLYAAQS